MAAAGGSGNGKPSGTSPRKSSNVANRNTSLQSQNNSKKSGLTQEGFNQYGAFTRRIRALEKIQAKTKPQPNIYVVYSGTYTDGKSWCGLCNLVDRFIKKEIIPRHKAKGYLLWVQVGDVVEWQIKNPFKLDPKLRVKSIPTIVLWGSEKRLETPQLYDDGELIKDLFDIEEDFDVSYDFSY